MKKLIAVILCGLVLTGCGKSVGIIGGSDGPTAIFVANGDDSVTAQSIRMIKVDGELYYDSGKNSGLVPRCGTLDGALKKTANEFEIPAGDGESNFETSGYQSTTGMTKEVPLDGGWRIFRKIVDTEKDFSLYKYALVVEGRLPNAVRDSKYIVLANDKTLDFERVSKSLFSSNSEDFVDCYIIPVLDEDKWGIRLMAFDSTPKGLKIVCDQFGGSPTGDLQTGEWYGLEVMDENNKWVKVEYLPHEYDIAWHSIAYQIRKNDRTEWEVNWEWLYGSLPEGHYRIGKEIMDFRAAGDFDKDVYYAEFFIN